MAAPGGKNRLSMKELSRGAVEQLKRISFVQPKYKHAYIVVGARTAAGYAVRALVDKGVKPGEVALITDQEDLPFEGPALTSALLKNGGNLEHHYTCVGESLPAQSAQWYRDNGVVVYPNVALLSHNPAESLVRSVDFVEFIYTTALIIATGTSAIALDVPHPPAAAGSPDKSLVQLSRPDANDVFYLDSVHEVRRLLTVLDSPKQCVVVGGSSNGVETAATLCEMGHSVTLVCEGDHVMAGMLSQSAARSFEDLLTKKGVTIATDLKCVAFLERNSRLRACKFHTGEVIDAEVAVVSVGRAPNLGPFAESLRTQKSGDMVCIKVDSNFQTSAEGVYAVGDIAAMPFAQFGSTQTQHASHARASARFVVDHLFAPEGSEPLTYNYVPVSEASIFGRSWQVHGETSGDLSVTQGSLEGKFISLWVWERKLLGVLVSGLDEADVELARKLAAEQPVLDDIALKKCVDVDAVLALLRQSA